MAIATTTALALGAAAASAAGSMAASKTQAGAASKAGNLAATNQAANAFALGNINNQNQDLLTGQNTLGQQQIQQGYAAAEPYYAGAQDWLNRGYDQQRSDIQTNTDAGIRDINSTYSGARNAIAGGYDSAIGTVAPAYANARNASSAMSNQAAGVLGPYAVAGQNALAREQDMLGIGDPNYRFQASDPSYQWRLEQGLGATNAQAAASGLNGSGARLIALNDYAQGAASQEYGNQFGRVAGLAGQGQQAASGISNIYAHQGDNLAGLYTGESGALSGLYTGKGNAIGNSLMQQGNTLAGVRQNLGNSLGNSAYSWGVGSAGLQTQQAGNQIQQGNALAGYGQQNIGQQVASNQNYANALVGNNNQGTAAQGQAIQDQGTATASGYAGVGKAVSSGLGTYAGYQAYGSGYGNPYAGRLVQGAAPQTASSINWLAPRRGA